MSLVRRYPLIAFFVLACALSWWPWILHSVGRSPNPIVGFGPFLAALVVLIVMLFHNMNNSFSSGFVDQIFSGADSVNQAWLRLALWAVVAIVLVVVYGSQNLPRKHSKAGGTGTARRICGGQRMMTRGLLMDAEWRPIVPDAPR
jgi:fumarate reductase subunit C